MAGGAGVSPAHNPLFFSRPACGGPRISEEGKINYAKKLKTTRRPFEQK